MKSIFVLKKVLDWFLITQITLLRYSSTRKGMFQYLLVLKKINETD